MEQNRRKFITTMAVAGVAIPFKKTFGSYFSGSTESNFPVRLFSKPLDNYDFDFMCECIAKAGISGFDLTVRPGGKVEPADVETIFPKLVDEAGRNNLSIDMMTSGIITAEDPHTERVLKTASSLGITHYRLGYLDYDNNIGIWESLRKHKASLRGVLDLNRKYKIHGGYQNHAGSRVGGPVWDLYEILRDFPPEFIGCQYDVRHAMVEGANAWILGMRLIANHIKTLAIKDFTWMTQNGKPRAVTVPLGEGMVDWDTFFQIVKEKNIKGPITLHIEYPLLEKGEEKLPLIRQQEIIVKKLSKDVVFLNSYLTKYQLI